MSKPNLVQAINQNPILDEKELKSFLKAAEMEINSFVPSPLEFNTDDSTTPPIKVVNAESLERIKEEVSDIAAEKRAVVINKFVHDVVTKLATDIANNTVTPLTQQITEINVNVATVTSSSSVISLPPSVSAPITGSGTVSDPFTVRPATTALNGSMSATDKTKVDLLNIGGAAPTVGYVPAWDGTAYTPAAVSSGGGGITNAFTSSYTFSGGVHDYTADTNFTLPAFSASIGSPSQTGTDVLGDGSSVPYFYAGWRSGSGTIAALSRTAGATLKLQPSDALANTESYPFGLLSCWVMIPLPSTDEIQIDATLIGTFGTISGSQNGRVYMAVGGNYGNNLLFVDAAVGYHWDTVNHVINDELDGPVNVASRTGQPAENATAAAFKSGAVATRRYRIILRGPTVQILGAPTSAPTSLASPVVLLQQRDMASRVLGLKRYLILGVAGSSPVTIGLFGEITNVTITGIRSYI